MEELKGPDTNNSLDEQRARYEDDAGKHLLSRTHADFSEELIRRPGHTTAYPFFIGKNGAPQARHRAAQHRLELFQGTQQYYPNPKVARRHE